MTPKTLLIANRGEIAIRIARAAAELGIRAVAVFSEDDAASLHRLRADDARPLRGVGAAAYLDGEQIVEIAKQSGCEAIHPGYGFVSESAAFARRCADEGILFIGPRPEILELFGDKVRARQAAARCDVPVLAATRGPTRLAEAIAFFEAQGDAAAVMVKAIAGGGGRGMRAVHRLGDLEDAFTRCQSLLFLERQDDLAVAESSFAREIDVESIRSDLAEVIQRHESTLDAARPEAVARRRKTGQRTARENIADLCDPDSLVEYGALAVAAQRRRRTMEDLIRNTPADGLVCGHATVNGELFGPERAHCVVMSYDFTVLAGTQGHLSHRKTDRMLELARERHLPLVLFAEGGGGRPGDTDGDISSNRTFREFARLSGLVPLVGIVSGRCFAGNASLLGCCDVVIAARDANIGMGGPAMIESGGLGIFRPEEIGPIGVQVPNGVVDVAVADEAEAVRAARKYLSYFQGSLRDWECADQRLLRQAIPENRLRVYDVLRLIETLADTGSVLELRRGFGRPMITALIRIEGRAIGIVANDPMHLAGAIDSDSADKASRFIRLCDAVDIPLVYLCDTPGIMVGPEVEKTALVRHAARLFLSGSNATVPFLTIVLRKAYGLGALAMSAGTYDAATASVAWPTGEFATMAIEGAAKLGYRNELAAIADPAERRAKFDERVAVMYERSKALNQATHFVIDDVIDPADTRRWIAATLRSTPVPAPRMSKKHPFVDSW